MAQTAPYPTIPAPYGLRPINLIGGQVFAGATRQLPITPTIGNGGGSINYNTPIYYGDVVQLSAANSTIIISTLDTDTSPVAGVVGVFLGCTYTNPVTKQKTFSQYWPGFASGVTDAFAYVADDPDQLYRVASVGNTVNTTGLVISAVSQVVVGNNATLILNAGNATSGNSRTGVFANAVETSLPMRVVDGIPDTATADGYTELVVKFNFGYHSYNNAVGVAV
jgi:hypothetical protein